MEEASLVPLVIEVWEEWLVDGQKEENLFYIAPKAKCDVLNRWRLLP